MESLPQRKQNRLNGYDYSQNGCYFVTICTKNRCPLFWVTTINPHCVGADIGQLKRYVSKKIGFSIWQKSYHDHIIRNESDYATAAEYIESNPLRRLFGERP